MVEISVVVQVLVVSSGSSSPAVAGDVLDEVALEGAQAAAAATAPRRSQRRGPRCRRPPVPPRGRQLGPRTPCWRLNAAIAELLEWLNPVLRADSTRPAGPPTSR